MKPLSEYIQEKLVIKKGNNLFDYKYFPETKQELRDLIRKRVGQEGYEVDLNDIDTSKITDMSDLFEDFEDENFNGDISNWDVSKVIDMSDMFYGCKSFNQDISNWNVSNVINMNAMFYKCKSFNQDISNWDVSRVKYFRNIFTSCPIEEKYKPKFK